MNKKGQGLPLTTIIVAILVVVVLVVIVAFFLGGTTGLTNTIKRVFFGTTAGTDLSLAVEACRNHCDRATTLPKSLQSTSAYCTTKFRIDSDGNGEAEFFGEGEARRFVDWYCWRVGAGTYTRALNVPCQLEVQCQNPLVGDTAPPPAGG